VFFLEQLPLAGTNKVDRDRLRSIVAGAGDSAEKNSSAA
jgi:hypothetical protein